MGMIQNLMEKIRERREKIAEENEQLGDDDTRDKFLRSLRRERRIQMEEVEKEQLKKKIAEFKKQRMRKHLFGVNDKIQKKNMISAMDDKKKVEVLGGHKSMIKHKEILRENNHFIK